MHALDDAPQSAVIDAQYVWRHGFEVLRHVARGPIADVWLVRDVRSGEHRAWKMLRRERGDDRTAQQLLANEAEVGRRVLSRYVVRTLDAQVDAAPRFVVHDWYPGNSLETLLRDQAPLPLQQALWISRQAAQGLADLERAGYAHGDLKPDNIIVGHDGQVKLIDLAFARPLDRSDGERDTRIAGTPEYLAPETLQRGAGTPLSKDLYSLGVTMYRMLAGRLPFQGETSADVLRQQREAVPRPLRTFAPGVPRELAELVENLLSKQPLRRPHSAAGLIDRLVMLELALLPSVFQG